MHGQNALTVDVEDYFQVEAFAGIIDRGDWDGFPRRVVRNTERLLDLFAETGVSGTFFTLGWIAERYPHLVRRIAGAGHEVASHGFAHRRVSAQSPAEFLADIRLAKAILEDVSGQDVAGYRAPSFSISESNRWAFDAIMQAGYRYSSSIYPIRHDHYGMPHAPRFAHESRPGLIEIPIATVRILRRNLPAGGGGYFRLLPYRISRWSIERINACDGKPTMFYFHPWELDVDQPRVAASLKSRYRHYVNLRRMAPRIASLLRDFRWSRADRVFLRQAA